MDGPGMDIRIAGVLLILILAIISGNDADVAIANDIVPEEPWEPAWREAPLLTQLDDGGEEELNLVERVTPKSSQISRNDDISYGVTDPSSTPIGQQVAIALRYYLNQQLLLCKITRIETFNLITLESLSVQPVQGLLITSQFKAQTAKAGIHTFTTKMIRQLHPHPKYLPSVLSAGFDTQSVDPMVNFEVLSLSPPLCSASEELTQQEPQEDLLLQIGEEAARSAAPPNSRIWAPEMELTQLQSNSMRKSFSWYDEIPEAAAWRTHISRGHAQGACGNSWAWAGATTMSLRFYIQSGKKANPALAPHWFTACASKQNGVGGCSGGNVQMAIEAMSATANKGGAVTEACDPYPNPSPFEGDLGHCVADSKTCRRYFSQPYLETKQGNYFLKTFANKKESIIMEEIMKEGPLYVSFLAYDDLLRYEGGIYRRESQNFKGTHSATLIGWGEESGKKYWLALNSWGTDWGEKGFFRVAMDADDNGVMFTTHGLFGMKPAVQDVCKAACLHGDMDNKCRCTCRDGYGGDTCNTCKRDCTGERYTGDFDPSSCKCHCQKGYFGEECQLHVTVPSQVNSGALSTVKYSQTRPSDLGLAADLVLRADDRIIFFPKYMSTAVWDWQSGWEQAEAVVKCPAAPGNSEKCSVEASIAFTLYDPGSYTAYLIKHQGKTATGASKGYKIEQKLGDVDVPHSPHNYRPVVCEDQTPDTLCHKLQRLCTAPFKPADIQIQGQRMSEYCMKTCNHCPAKGSHSEKAAKAKSKQAVASSSKVKAQAVASSSKVKAKAAATQNAENTKLQKKQQQKQQSQQKKEAEDKTKEAAEKKKAEQEVKTKENAEKKEIAEKKKAEEEVQKKEDMEAAEKKKKTADFEKKV